MPTYEYECSSCGHRFEKSHGMNHKHSEHCPKCGKSAKKLISRGAGIIFKGSGFYATDYKKSCPSKHKKEGCSGCPHNE